MDRSAILVDAGYLIGAATSAARLGARGTVVAGRIVVHFPDLISGVMHHAYERTHLPLLRLYWYSPWPETHAGQELRTLQLMAEVKVRVGVGQGEINDQAGVSTPLQRDLLSLARNHAVCDVVILTADENLVPIIEEAQSYGVKVHLWGAQSADGSHRQSSALIATADSRLVIAADWVKQFTEIVPGDRVDSQHDVGDEGAAFPARAEPGVFFEGDPLTSPMVELPIVGASDQEPHSEFELPGLPTIDDPLSAHDEPAPVDADRSTRDWSPAPAADHPLSADPDATQWWSPPLAPTSSPGEAPSLPAADRLGTASDEPPATASPPSPAEPAPDTARTRNATSASNTGAAPSVLSMPSTLGNALPMPVHGHPTEVDDEPPTYASMLPPSDAVVQLADVTEPEIADADALADAAFLESNRPLPEDIGYRYGCRWAARTTADQQDALIARCEPPYLPRKVAQELAQYAATFPLPAQDVELIALSLAMGFWHALLPKVSRP